MNEEKKIKTYPFLDWSLVQAGTVKFRDSVEGQRLASPRYYNMPCGISINSQEAKKTAFWLKADKPWEVLRLSGAHAVIYEDGVYRLWYESFGSDYHGSFDARLCYAESSDGLNWKKPTLNLIEYEGDKKTNIVFDKSSNGGFGHCGGTVFLDPVAPSSERYKYIFLGEQNKGQIRAAVSKDGLLWKSIPEPIMDPYHSDTQSIAYYDRIRGSYVGYFRSWIDDLGCLYPDRRRAIARAETKDFKKWPTPETVFSLGVNHHPAHDLYTNAHILYPNRDDLHLFFPAQYDRDKDTLEIYLASSRDGVRLEYFGNNPVVTLGKKGSGQEGRIYAGCGLVPLDEDKLALPCFGLSYTHNDDVLDNDDVPGTKSYSGVYFWATWKKDRLVAIEAADEGSFALSFLSHQVSKLYLNFTSKPAGEIKVQISDTSGERGGPHYSEGKPISGYTFSDCNPIQGDELKYPVTWQEKTEISVPQAKPVVIQFKMRQAKLFALYTEE